MLVVAGGYNSGLLDTVELLRSVFAPAWQQAAARLPYREEFARMTLLGGSLLLAGGFDGDILRAGECYVGRLTRPA